jgi:transcriptional regulator with XRE-family HTH domain
MIWGMTAPTGPQVKIRHLREAYGLTLNELAQRISEQGVDVHPDHLSNVELGRKRASRALLIAWAKALQLNPLDIWQAPNADRSDAGERVAS